jgi:predicted transcriptional regulator
MPTSVHIPKALLVAADRKARALKISRNRLIVQALEREVSGRSDWSPEFFARLESAEPGLARTVEQLLGTIRRNRRSKGPVTL